MLLLHATAKTCQRITSGDGLSSPQSRPGDGDHGSHREVGNRQNRRLTSCPDAPVRSLERGQLEHLVEETVKTEQGSLVSEGTPYPLGVTWMAEEQASNLALSGRHAERLRVDRSHYTVLSGVIGLYFANGETVAIRSCRRTIHRARCISQETWPEQSGCCRRSTSRPPLHSGRIATGAPSARAPRRP
jgi:hypothetical protein